MDQSYLASYAKPIFRRPMNIQNLSLLWESMERLSDAGAHSRAVRLTNFHLKEANDTLELVTNLEKYFFPKSLLATLEYIQKNKIFSISELPGLPAEEKVRVIRSFVESGFVAIIPRETFERVGT